MSSKRYTPTFAILAALLFAVSFLNNELLSKSAQEKPSLVVQQVAQSSLRLPASNNVNWEELLIKKYTSSFREQKGLIIGKRPDLFDKFTFGTLNGSYAIHYSGGKIAGLEINEASDSSALVIEDTYSFISKNKNLLAVEFDSISKISERHEGNRIYEEYGLFDANSVKVATAALESDQENRFLALKIVRDGQLASN